MELFVKDFFSFVNIGLIWYLLTVGREIPKKAGRTLTAPNSYKIVCLLAFLGIRFLQNRLEIHIFWVFITVLTMSVVCGYVWEKHSVRYSMLVSCAFFTMVSLSWIAADMIFFCKAKRVSSELRLAMDQKIFLILIEVFLIIGILCIGKIIRRVPLKISGKSFLAVMLSLITNITFTCLIARRLYYHALGFVYLDIPNPDIQITVSILIAGVTIAVSSSISLSILESYLNVKYIENDKKLRITELNLQYDYYTRLERDMEQVRRLSHDIRNHLEALKGSNDEARKQEYIESIENHLKRFESYYKTGNTFIDSLLRRKKEEAAEQKIQFKVIADLRPFHSIKDEDLCVMIANALDNALRECTLRQGEEPEEECLIQLKAGKVREFLSIVCENSMREGEAKRIQEEEELKTTKEDKEYHGYGIKNIEGAVHKYGGEMSIVVRDQMFCLSIMIPL